MKKILEIGCGLRKRDGAIGMDVVPLPGVDVVHDVDVCPYPFENDMFDEVYAVMILEHVKDLLLVMAELHRILKPGGIIYIKVPYYNSTDAYSDPTHKQFFTEKTLLYFTEDIQWNFYTSTRFKVQKIELKNNSDTLSQKIRNMIPGKKILKNFIFNMYDEIEAELIKI